MNHADWPPAPEVLEQAATWFARLSAAGPGDQERALRTAWQSWLQGSPAHARAWQEVEAICGRLATLPGPLARQTLQGLSSRSALRRRQLLRGASLSLGVLAVGGLSWQMRAAGEDGRWQTAWAERRDWPLPDGSRLWLQARSNAELQAGPEGPLLHLQRGELLIEPALAGHGRPSQTSAAATRSTPPLSLSLPSGQRLHAAVPGSRFSLRQAHAGRASELHVFTGAVALRGVDAPVPAGRAVALPAPGQAPVSLGPAQALRQSWVQGRLIAEGLRLDALLEELSACHPGRLDCSADLAGLRVVGSLPWYELEACLAILAEILPLQAQRLLPGWVRLRARR